MGIRSVVFLAWGLTMGLVNDAQAQVSYEVQVPDSVKVELESIRQASGLAVFTVTSYERPVAKQADLMFGLLKCSGRVCAGVADVKEQYCELGDKAVDILLADSTWQDTTSGVTILTRALTSVLTAAGPSRQCLMHVVGSGISSPHHAVDVAPSSIPIAQRPAFLAAVKENAKVVKARFFEPGAAEKAYHIEFPRS
jgi:hypothetical protein